MNETTPAIISRPPPSRKLRLTESALPILWWMFTFFDGWRRKAGCVRLVMGVVCVFERANVNDPQRAAIQQRIHNLLTAGRAMEVFILVARDTGPNLPAIALDS